MGTSQAQPLRGRGRPARSWVVAAAALIAVPITMTVASPAFGQPGRVVSAARGRVDIAVPKFSHPTRITNPLFPITATRQMIALGSEGDVALRQETTLLNRTRTLHVNGKDVEVVVSQFVAHGDRDMQEVAVDYFAQADDGSVWYFGEDVTTYEAGAVKSHDGTWLAGRDGPPGMIMPAHPQVGDVYRPENIPGLVFEETTVKAVGLTVAGPSGLIHGAIRVEEHPADGDVETKVYAPGYGEFEATVPASQEHVISVLAIPTDLRHGSEPDALDSLSDRAHDLFSDGGAPSWSHLRSEVRALHHSWTDLQATNPPKGLAAEMVAAIEGVDAAVTARNRRGLAQAGLDVEFAATDLELQYTDFHEVDHDRIGSWQSQRKLHKAAGNAEAVASDGLIIRSIKDRLAH